MSRGFQLTIEFINSIISFTFKKELVMAYRAKTPIKAAVRRQLRKRK
jgi:hypothetical protein